MFCRIILLRYSLLVIKCLAFNYDCLIVCLFVCFVLLFFSFFFFNARNTVNYHVFGSKSCLLNLSIQEKLSTEVKFSDTPCFEPRPNMIY